MGVLKPSGVGARIKSMTSRRTFAFLMPALFAPPLALSACAQAADAPERQAAGGLTGPGGVQAALLELTGGLGNVAWLSLSGDVRSSPLQGSVQSGKVWRAVRARSGSDGPYLEMFDVFKLEDGELQLGPTTGQQPRLLEISPKGFWLEREVRHPAFGAGVESAHLARQGARLMVLADNRIWLVEGGLGAPPPFSSAQSAEFAAWQAT
jgi:hypothetical protein